jgi:hypothetical protein
MRLMQEVVLHSGVHASETDASVLLDRPVRKTQADDDAKFSFKPCKKLFDWLNNARQQVALTRH